MIEIKSAEILCVGTEILIGDIVNTNAAYISKKLAELGINQYYQAVVGDNPKRLEFMINEALKRCDLLIMSGGLGPTYDDLTKETAAKCMGRTLFLHERSLFRIENYFAHRGTAMTENNKKQAYIPENAIVFDNNYGTAPGCAIEDEARGKIIIMLPGPPRELIPMVNDFVVPYLEKFSNIMFISRNINIIGMGESAVENELRDLMVNSQNPTIAPYCKDGEVRLRVTAKALNKAEGEKLCDKIIEQIRLTPVGKYIYGIDTTLEEAVVDMLKSSGKTVATAESCTGGLLAERITQIAGSSEVFDGGVVTYANRIKEQLISVRSETLEKYGAVSEETAREMAEGVRKLIGASIGIGITGIAGPGGGTAEKPVGLIYVACSDNSGTSVRKLKLAGNRELNRKLSTNNALSMIIEALKK